MASSGSTSAVRPRARSAARVVQDAPPTSLGLARHALIRVFLHLKRGKCAPRRARSRGALSRERTRAPRRAPSRNRRIAARWRPGAVRDSPSRSGRRASSPARGRGSSWTSPANFTANAHARGEGGRGGTVEIKHTHSSSVLAFSHAASEAVSSSNMSGSPCARARARLTTRAQG